MAYTKRTCYHCGWRDIQPNMYQREVEYTSGSSNTALSGRTWFGFLLGEKKSASRISTWLFAPNKRTYKRRKKVWVCSKCR